MMMRRWCTRSFERSPSLCLWSRGRHEHLHALVGQVGAEYLLESTVSQEEALPTEPVDVRIDGDPHAQAQVEGLDVEGNSLGGLVLLRSQCAELTGGGGEVGPVA
jgi:hypothetical protein